MYNIIEYIFNLVLGSRASQGLAALRTVAGVPALVALVEKMQWIESGGRIEVRDREIQDAMDELKRILDAGVDNNQLANPYRKEMLKFGNQMVVRGCYMCILDTLGQKGYSVQITA